MKQSLTQKQTLKQTASMQTVQFMKLLEMPANHIEDEIRKELEENPALEIDDDESFVYDENSSLHDDYSHEEEFSDTAQEVEVRSNIQDDDYADFYNSDEYDDYVAEKNLNYELSHINFSKDDKEREWIVVNDYSLQEDLLTQLGVFDITERERKIAEYVIGNLDDSGYLEQDVKTIASDLLFKYNIKADEVEIEKIITQYVQELDPAGVGARNLQECLLLQLKRKVSTPEIETATKIITNCFDDFLKKRYDKIITYTRIGEADLKQALEEIQRLDPHPVDAQTLGEQVASYIIPDFTIAIENGKPTLYLNTQNIPKLRVNQDFKEQYSYFKNERNTKLEAEARKYLKKNIENASVFINMLSQRELTLYNTMHAIMKKQEAYFLSGNDMDIKPMILKDIAEEVGIDISTVSRVSSSKYIQTPYGTIPVKKLFSESIGHDDVSSIEVKGAIAELIEKEDKKSPLTDEELCELLTKKGYSIARRTVAKYREQLGFPVARLRREL